jgi:hypothetical protein
MSDTTTVASTTSVALGTGLIYPALRIAGITDRPGRTPSPDQAAEVIPILNRMMGTWNCSRLRIYSRSLDRYALNPAQTTYFIGPNGDFVAPRPVRILRANAVLTASSPELHYHIRILEDTEWMSKLMPELPAGMWPVDLYDDYAQPDSQLYLYPYPQVPVDLELLTFNGLVRDFTSLLDQVDLPDGYEDAIVLNLAEMAAIYYPRMASLSPEVPRFAARALAAIENNNAPVPKLGNDASGLSRQRNGEGWNWWRSGGFGS